MCHYLLYNSVCDIGIKIYKMCAISCHFKVALDSWTCQWESVRHYWHTCFKCTYEYIYICVYIYIFKWLSKITHDMVNHDMVWVSHCAASRPPGSIPKSSVSMASQDVNRIGCGPSEHVLISGVDRCVVSSPFFKTWLVFWDHRPKFCLNSLEHQMKPASNDR